MGKNQTESPLEGEELEGMPLPEQASNLSEGEPTSAADSQTPIDEATLQKLVDERVKDVLLSEETRNILRGEIERGIQSAKDVRWKLFENLDPAEVRIVADAVKKADGDAAKAAKDLGVQAAKRSQPGPSEPTSSTQEPAPADDKGMSEAEIKRRRSQAYRILSKSGLSDDEQRQVIDEWAALPYEGEYSNALENLTEIITKVQRPASMSAAALPIGGEPVGSPTQRQEAIDGLWSELAELQREPSKNQARRAEVKKKLKELGEPV